MKAIPTHYNGVNYRSLLEARYAAWFDLIGVPVQYEPEAWPGYIPDFMYKDHVHGKNDTFWTDDDYEETLVGWYDEDGYECFNKGKFAQEQMVFEVKGSLEGFDLEKIRRSGWQGAVVVLDGRGPKEGFAVGSGTIYQADWGGGSSYSWRDFVKCFLQPTHRDPFGLAWKEAGNLVQWKAPSQFAARSQRC